MGICEVSQAGRCLAPILQQLHLLPTQMLMFKLKKSTEKAETSASSDTIPSICNPQKSNLKFAKLESFNSYSPRNLETQEITS